MGASVAHARARRVAVGLALAVALILVACSGAPASCRELPLTAVAASEEREAVARVDFAPRRPCAFVSGLRVRSVFVDVLPEAGGLARLSYLAEGPGGASFTFSRTRAELPFRAIPQGSRHVRVAAAGATAEGFVGPSGTGVEFAYLRWRHDGVTAELVATLRGRLTLGELERIAGSPAGRSP